VTVGVVMDGRALITDASLVRPDVIVLDVAMPVPRRAGTGGMTN
jgi:chemotaxis response regulator CheB